jgi:hypothetical protein
MTRACLNSLDSIVITTTQQFQYLVVGLLTAELHAAEATIGHRSAEYFFGRFLLQDPLPTDRVPSFVRRQGAEKKLCKEFHFKILCFLSLEESPYLSQELGSLGIEIHDSLRMQTENGGWARRSDWIAQGGTHGSGFPRTRDTDAKSCRLTEDWNRNGKGLFGHFFN